jgi:polyisoprenoid-binding protein YceI
LTTTIDTTQTLPAGTWSADPIHSELAFGVDYMAGTFRGTFSRFGAELVDGELRGSAEVASVQVKDEALEAHLQSPDFFDAERHPTLRFRSREVRRSASEITVSGEITIKGHTEPVELRGTVGEPIGDPFGGERFGLRLETTLDRTAFGLTWNNPLPTGEPALATEVTIAAELQLVRQTPDIVALSH